MRNSLKASVLLITLPVLAACATQDWGRVGAFLNDTADTVDEAQCADPVGVRAQWNEENDHAVWECDPVFPERFIE